MKKKITLGAIVLISLVMFIGYPVLQKEESKKAITNTASISKSKLSTAESTQQADMSEETKETTTPERNLPDLLQPYTDEEIEYARVWLAVMGADYLNHFAEPNSDFELKVTALPAGTPVNQFAEGRITYPVDTIYLTGKSDAQGSLVYSSNHDGSVTTYPIPKRDTYTEENAKDPTYLDKLVKEMAESTKLVTIPAGEPETVKKMIELMVINL